MHLLNGNVGSEKISSLSLTQLQQMYNQQLNHQAQEVAAAKSEANRLKQQLRIETDSRKDAQVLPICFVLYMQGSKLLILISCMSALNTNGTMAINVTLFHRNSRRLRLRDEKYSDQFWVRSKVLTRFTQRSGAGQ